MKILPILFLFTTLLACSQNQEEKKFVPKPKAKLLADSAATVLTTEGGNIEKVVDLLEQATQIDSNFYNAFYNKLTFQISLKRYKDALISGKNLMRIKPLSLDAYMYSGMISWKLGDTIAAISYFNKANELFERILDTMSISNKYYEFALVNKAYNLILAGQSEKGNKILIDLYTKQNEDDKQMFKEFLNKSRKDILNDLFNPDNGVSGSSTILKN